MVETSRKKYSKAEYDKICEFAGNFFEYDDGTLCWRHNGLPIADEIITQLLNQEDILIYSEMATIKHHQLITNIQKLLYKDIDTSLFRIYGNAPTICIFINGKEKIRIPDVTVTPKQLVFTANKEVVNPLVIFEVVSPSSVQIDYIDKLREYKFIESLEDYIIVEQDKHLVTHYQRHSPTEWYETKIDTLTDYCMISTVGIRLEMQEIYADCENL